MKIFGRFLCVLFASSALHANPQSTDWGKITFYGTDWAEDQVRVQTTAPFINPTPGCANTDGYMTDSTEAGNHAQQSALLAAFAAGKEVQIILEGCNSVSRPRIIGVYVR